MSGGIGRTAGSEGLRFIIRRVRRIVGRRVRICTGQSERDSDPPRDGLRRFNLDSVEMEFERPLAGTFRFLRDIDFETSSQTRSRSFLRSWPFRWCCRDGFCDAGFYCVSTTISGPISRPMIIRGLSSCSEYLDGKQSRRAAGDLVTEADLCWPYLRPCNR
jgi:hypothetical protein